MAEPTVDVLARCVADACNRLASDAGWDDYGIHRDKIAAEYHELEAAVAELIEALQECIEAEQPMAQMHATERARAALARFPGAKS